MKLTPKLFLKSTLLLWHVVMIRVVRLPIQCSVLEVQRHLEIQQLLKLFSQMVNYFQTELHLVYRWYWLSSMY